MARPPPGGAHLLNAAHYTQRRTAQCTHTFAYSRHNREMAVGVQEEWSLQWGRAQFSVSSVLCVMLRLHCAQWTLQWGGGGGPSPLLFATLGWHPGVQVTLSSTVHTAPCPHSCTLKIAHLRDCTVDSAHLVGSQVYIQVTLPSPMPPVTANQRYQLTLIHPTSSTSITISTVQYLEKRSNKLLLNNYSLVFLSFLLIAMDNTLVHTLKKS